MGSDKKQEEIHAVSLHTGALIKTYRLFVSLTGDWDSISLGPVHHLQTVKRAFISKMQAIIQPRIAALVNVPVAERICIFTNFPSLIFTRSTSTMELV